MINPKELKTVKEILDYLNEQWEPPAKGIPSQKYINGKLVDFYAKVDPYFTAYLNSSGTWWLCVSDYKIWNESYPIVKELLDCIKTFKIFPCFIHPIQTKMFKDRAKERKSVLLFIGKVSWAV